jgi:hypothetical protein
MKNETKERIAQIQNELRDLMARDTDVGSPEASALLKANEWLDGITNPLTTEEAAEWDEYSDDYCTDMANDMDAWAYANTVTVSEKRAAIGYGKE